MTFSAHNQIPLSERRSMVSLPVDSQDEVQTLEAQLHDPLSGATIVSLSGDRQHKLLTQIAWNIRRTLDLPTIWHQTVEGLGNALGVNRCIICPYEVNQPTVKVAAEYCRGPRCPMQGLEFLVADDADLSLAIATQKPTPIERDLGDLPDNHHTPLTLRDLLVHSMLIVTTSYQDQPNGLIVLYLDDQSRTWTHAEIDFVQELADQVGTAIAHANLIAASQALAAELQKANKNLLQKHCELEEARQQAEDASRLKSEFLANTSHELRTPLNGMIGFLKLILEGMADDPEEQEEFVQEAYRSALHLLSIMDDILDIAKIEAGKLQLELRPVKLDELMDRVAEMCNSQVRQKNLSFEMQKLPTDDEIILYGDYKRLLQVMLNLVSNAIKFTHEGGVTISTEIIKKKIVVQNHELPGFVKIRVADTGIGVSLDKQDKLFQSFSQVDGSRTRQYGGTGLGLTISQKLVEAMGGVVNFYSMGDGLGSTVTFTVPLYQEPVMITAQA
jgi:signal transduction histidine kinase